MNKNSKIIPILFLGTIFLALAVFWPALTGPFLLDDLLHLPKLKGSQSVTDTESFYNFVFSGGRTPGRFLSYLSLLIDDNAWPSTPLSYKYTNLMLHLLNGVLVFVFVRKLLSLLSFNINKEYAAVALMAIWLVHPMQLSTVMYVIQRMTILSSTFILLGLIGYLQGREILATRILLGYFIMTLSIALIGSISFCFKEIGINLVLFVWVIEFALLGVQVPVREKYFTTWKVLFLGLPVLLLFLYMAYLGYTGTLTEMTMRRNFTIGERLLTESRVLFDYLGSIIFPRVSDLTLYHDDYIVSRGILNPITTIVSIVAWAILVLFGVLYRGLPGFAILWFLSSHILESSVIPIELYFEHRNYLPMLGPLLAVTVGLLSIHGKLKILSRVFVGFYILLMSFLCFGAAQVWGSTVLLTKVWESEHSTSTRAIFDSVRLNLMMGERDAALKNLRKIQEIDPTKVSVPMFEDRHFNCGGDSESRINEEYIAQMSEVEFDLGVITAVQQLTNMVSSGRCPNVSPQKLTNLIEVFIQNENYQGYKKGLTVLYESNARMYMRRANLEGAIQNLNKAYDVYPRYEHRVQQAVLLMSAGLYDEAQKFLDKARETKPINRFNVLGKNRAIENTQKALNVLIARQDR